MISKLSFVGQVAEHIFASPWAADRSKAPASDLPFSFLLSLDRKKNKNKTTTMANAAVGYGSLFSNIASWSSVAGLAAWNVARMVQPYAPIISMIPAAVTMYLWVAENVRRDAGQRVHYHRAGSASPERNES